MQTVVYYRSYSGTYCDICDVTDHDTEDCPEQTFESLSSDGVPQIGNTSCIDNK